MIINKCIICNLELRNSFELVFRCDADFIDDDGHELTIEYYNDKIKNIDLIFYKNNFVYEINYYFDYYNSGCGKLLKSRIRIKENIDIGNELITSIDEITKYKENLIFK